MSKKSKRLAGLILLFALFTLWGIPKTVQAADTEEQIRNGVYIGGIELSGMTKEQAVTAVNEYIATLKDYVMHLKIGSEFVSVTTGDLGLKWKNPEIIDEAVKLGKSGNIVSRYKVIKDLEEEPHVYDLQYDLDSKKLKGVIEDQCVPLNRDPVNATLTRADDAFQIVDGTEGMSVNVDGSMEAIRSYIGGEWTGGDSTISLDVTIEPPKGTAEELNKIQDVLGEFSTDYSTGTDGRNTNVELGAEKVNGHVVYPGEEFSVIDSMVPFSKEAGWTEAHAYEGGKVVDSIGGGICQVSTTLYNALIRAELEVTERSNHSMTVKYVPLSMDAAISEGSKDLRFKNNLDVPIYVEGSAQWGSLSFRIWGQEYRSADRTIEFETKITSETEPGTKLEADPSKSYGSMEMTQSAYTGYTAELWKIVTENGQTTTEKVNDSYYNATPTIYTVGTSTSDGDAGSRLASAIATNNPDNVYSVLNGGSISGKTLQEVGETVETFDDGTPKTDMTDADGDGIPDDESDTSGDDEYDASEDDESVDYDAEEDTGGEEDAADDSYTDAEETSSIDPDESY